jgi:hypothetical protein
VQRVQSRSRCRRLPAVPILMPPSGRARLTVAVVTRCAKLKRSRTRRLRSRRSSSPCRRRRGYTRANDPSRRTRRHASSHRQAAIEAIRHGERYQHEASSSAAERVRRKLPLPRPCGLAVAAEYARTHRSSRSCAALPGEQAVATSRSSRPPGTLDAIHSAEPWSSSRNPHPLQKTTSRNAGIPDGAMSASMEANLASKFWQR